jgi:diguanylate cyclase (GGDEF)-like protein
MELEVQALRPGGNTFDAVMEFSPASIEGEACTQIVIRDQSINKELEKKIKYLSKQDLLTGLYNRQYFLEELNLAVSDAKSNKKAYTVFYIEPDNFKTIKENVGISGTDLVLGDIASLLRDNLEGSDIVSRFGDNSFTVLTRISDTNIVMALAEKIRSAIESHITDVGGKSTPIVCSIGTTLFDETVQDTQEVISNADLACELARKEGGNRVHLHNPIADKMAAQERDKSHIEMIQKALSDDRFILVYQPIASLHGDTGEKYEVLMRIHDEEGNEIMPGQFMPVAEDTGLIVEIDRWVIARAMKILAERRQSGSKTMFFVKLSGQSIADEELLPWIIKHLKENRLEGEGLVFELSEESVVNQLKTAQVFLKNLMELHCGFGLEHFGTGSNSIQILKHLPANFLKIDGTFMRNLASNRENQAIIKSISAMAASQGMITIAEFVEDASSLAVLWQCGVNLIQGHFLQKPDEMMNYDFEGEDQQSD